MLHEHCICEVGQRLVRRVSSTSTCSAMTMTGRISHSPSRTPRWATVIPAKPEQIPHCHKMTMIRISKYNTTPSLICSVGAFLRIGPSMFALCYKCICYEASSMITLGIKSPRTFYERTKKTPWAKMNSMRLDPQFVEVSWSSGLRVKKFNP